MATYRRVHVSELNVDSSYQREYIKRHAERIAKEFDWVAFGALSVALRADGTLWIVDGQQRYRAAKMLKINTVPCLITPAENIKNEAGAFILLNSKRRLVSAHVKFKANVLCGFSPEKEIAEFVNSIGLSIASNGKLPFGIDYARTLVDLWKESPENSMESLRAQKSICGISSLSQRIHVAFYYLFKHGIDVHKYTEKINRLGGATALIREMKSVLIEANRASSCGDSRRLFAVGVLRIINFKSRKKINIPKEV